MENIYQQAIADAKSLRASALANAKAALQEAFEPQIEEIVRLKLSEELEEELEEAEFEENFEESIEETEELEESELDEILAELEALSEDGDTVEDESVALEEAEESEEDAAEGDDEIEVDDTEADAEGDEETKEITVSLGDLKDLIDKIKSLDPDLAGDEDAEGEEGLEDLEASDEEAPAEDEEVHEESISLDEILAQLEEEEIEEGAEELGRPNVKLVQEPDTQAAAQGFNGHKIFEKKKGGTKDKEPIKGHGAKDGQEDTPYKKELKEAKQTIAELTQSLNEINLLNAKLLYMNKIFKAKSLSESQKIQVVKAFDKATSVKEVKNTFEVLKESVTTKKSQIQESFGYASKPAGVSPNSNVIDADPFVSRWQKLAGI
jgi:hypothetical protein